MSEGTKAITFADSGLDYRLLVEITETVCDENGPVYPQLVDERDATPADLAAVLAQHPELLAAVLPSAEELARKYYVLITNGYEVRSWEQLTPEVRNACWISDAAMFLKAMGVKA